MLNKIMSMIKKPKPDELYMDMRNQAFRLNPKDIRITRFDGQNVWGVVTDFELGGGYATMVSLASGTTNMYFSSGAGVLGAGDYSKVNQAAATLIEMAERHISQMELTTEFPLPAKGCVRFYLLTYSGIYTTEVPETIPYDEMTHPMYGLYAYSHNVIRQIRAIANWEAKPK